MFLRKIKCSTWDDIPVKVKINTVLDISGLDPNQLNSSNCIEVKKNRKLHIIGDKSKIYDNLFFVMLGKNTVILENVKIESYQSASVIQVNGKSNYIEYIGENKIITPVHVSPYVIHTKGGKLHIYSRHKISELMLDHFSARVNA